MSGHEPQLFGEKACSKCLEVKHVLAFPADPQNKDGLRSWCRECTNAASRLSKRRKSRLAGTRGDRDFKWSGVLFIKYLLDD